MGTELTIFLVILDDSWHSWSSWYSWWFLAFMVFLIFLVLLYSWYSWYAWYAWWVFAFMVFLIFLVILGIHGILGDSSHSRYSYYSWYSWYSYYSWWLLSFMVFLVFLVILDIQQAIIGSRGVWSRSNVCLGSACLDFNKTELEAWSTKACIIRVLLILWVFLTSSVFLVIIHYHFWCQLQSWRKDFVGNTRMRRQPESSRDPIRRLGDSHEIVWR